eukprot:CAMPEP_0179448932 /NCGR_PEP_ID=MMETSP0799-20121207/32936_1 /TAXON_ID=46947 /ORGANISM="Geminigera cryophila, Strain CCMP2564" /LENGTH=263 /DNA_ID=CAMNT_0021241585 /DNA_START=235 /DNA_END=1026 /DNA_ORIENTATION=-
MLQMVRQKAGEDFAPTTFMTALADIPPEVFEKMCPPQKTILLGMTAKSVLAILHKFPLEQRLPASVTLKKNAVPFLWSDPSTIVVATWCRTTLNLSGCYIRAAGAEQLANVVLCKCPSLIALNMGLNAIGAQGAEAIVSVLSQRPDMALRRLDLSFNGIGSAGISLIAPLLARLPALSTLNLSGDGVVDDGAALLATFLAQFPALSSLMLKTNGISHRGAMAVSAVLEHMPLLTYLDLSDNVFGRDAKDALTQGAPKSIELIV